MSRIASGRSSSLRSDAHLEPAGGEADRDAADGASRRSPAPASASAEGAAGRRRRARPGRRRARCASLIIDSPSTSSADPLGHAACGGRSRRGHGVGRRDDGAEHERRRPRRPSISAWATTATATIVRQHEPEREQRQRPQLGAQLPRRRVEARRRQQRRQEDEEDDVGLERRRPAGPGTSADRRARRARARSGTARRRSRRAARAARPPAAGRTGTRGRPRERHSTIGPWPTSLHPPLGPADHVRGAPGAPLELVMYGDFECPVLRGRAVDPRARARRGSGDRLRFAFRHFPLDAVHPHAPPRGRGRRGGGRPGRASGRCTTRSTPRAAGSRDADLVALARELGLDAERVDASWPPARTRPGSSATPSPRRRSGSARPRRSSSTASASRRLRRGLARRRPARLAVVPEEVVHPGLLGGWWFSKPQFQGGHRMKLHANAALIEAASQDGGWSSRTAGRSRRRPRPSSRRQSRTCSKWVASYREEGEPGLLDRCSAPRRVRQPHRRSGAIQVIAALRRLRFTAPSSPSCSTCRSRRCRPPQADRDGTFGPARP